MGPLLIESLRGVPAPADVRLVRRTHAPPPSSALARLARSARRRPVCDPVATPVLGEEEAATLLYGERSGTVVASPARPPVC
jgi:hypothetical protein